MKMMIKIPRNTYLSSLYCILLAMVGLSLYSYSTLPFLYKGLNWYDSSIFQVIGRGWAHGQLPYVNLWDNKGPIIYLIDALGYMLTGSSLGIVFIQLTALSLSLMVIRRIFLRGFSQKQSCLLLLLPVMSLVFNGWIGNHVEEYALPLLSLSYLLVLKWLDAVEQRRSVSHPPVYAFIYGLTLSFCLLTRLTNVVGVAACVLVILLFLIRHRQWSNLGRNAILFILGFITLTLPFVVYFWYKGALYEMIEASLLFNVKYFANASIEVSWSTAVYTAAHFMDTWLVLAAGVTMLLVSRRRIAAVTLTLVGLATTLWIFHSYAYSHYGVISLPVMAVALVELRRAYGESQRKGFRRMVAAVAEVYVVATILCFVVYRAHYFLKPPVNPKVAVYRQFMQGVPDSFRDSFVGYDIEPSYYLYEHITPACKFFAFQEMQPEGLDELAAMKRNAFRNGVKWIMVEGKADLIAGILREDYTLVKTDKANGLSLYRLKAK